jgi:hypothetical protein
MEAIARFSDESDHAGLHLAAEESLLELVGTVLLLQGSPRLKLTLIRNALDLHMEGGASVDEIERSPLRAVYPRIR